ncbi:unnamed protein product [Merluccius merluccius]
MCPGRCPVRRLRRFAHTSKCLTTRVSLTPLRPGAPYLRGPGWEIAKPRLTIAHCMPTTVWKTTGWLAIIRPCFFFCLFGDILKVIHSLWYSIH